MQARKLKAGLIGCGGRGTGAEYGLFKTILRSTSAHRGSVEVTKKGGHCRRTPVIYVLAVLFSLLGTAVSERATCQERKPQALSRLPAQTKRPQPVNAAPAVPLPLCAAELPDTTTAASPVKFRAWLPTASAASGKGQISGAQQWDFGDGSAKSIEVNPLHTFDKPGNYLWSLRIRGQGRGCQRDGIIIVRAAVEADRLVNVAAEKLLSGLKRNMSRQLRATLKGTSRYPIRVVLTDSIVGIPGSESACRSESATFRMIDDRLGDDVVLPEDVWVELGTKIGYRLKEGNFLCAGAETADGRTVRFVSGNLEDRGEIKFQQGARVLIDGTRYEHNGESWKGNEASLMSAEQARTLLGKISHSPSLVALAKNHSSPEVRSTAVDLIQDKRALRELAQLTTDKTVASRALSRLEQTSTGDARIAPAKPVLGIASPLAAHDQARMESSKAGGQAGAPPVAHAEAPEPAVPNCAVKDSRLTQSESQDYAAMAKLVEGKQYERALVTLTAWIAADDSRRTRGRGSITALLSAIAGRRLDLRSVSTSELQVLSDSLDRIESVRDVEWAIAMEIDFAVVMAGLAEETAKRLSSISGVAGGIDPREVGVSSGIMFPIFGKKFDQLLDGLSDPTVGECARHRVWQFFDRLNAGGPYFREGGIKSTREILGKLENAANRESSPWLRREAAQALKSMGVELAAEIPVAATTVPPTATATTPSVPSASVDASEVLARVRKALGGDALQRIQEYATLGTLSVARKDKEPYRWAVVEVVNFDNMHLKLQKGTQGAPDVAQGSTAEICKWWVKTPMPDTVRDCSPALRLFERARAQQDTLSLLRSSTIHPELKAPLVLDGKRTLTLELTDTALNRCTTFSVDPETYLILRKSYELSYASSQPTKDGETIKRTFTFYYSDYRSVQGAMIPHQVREVRGQPPEFNYAVDKVVLNPDVPKSAYLLAECCPPPSPLSGSGSAGASNTVRPSEPSESLAASTPTYNPRAGRTPVAGEWDVKRLPGRWNQYLNGVMEDDAIEISLRDGSLQVRMPGWAVSDVRYQSNVLTFRKKGGPSGWAFDYRATVESEDRMKIEIIRVHDGTKFQGELLRSKTPASTVSLVPDSSTLLAGLQVPGAGAVSR